MIELMGLRGLYGALCHLDDADTAIAYFQIKDPDELKDQIRVAAKYLAFDIEASRRENGHLKNLLDNKPYNRSKYSAGNIKSIATKEDMSHFFHDQPELSWLAEIYDIFNSVEGTSPIRKYLSGGIKSPSELVDMLTLYAGYLYFDLDATETENGDLTAQLETNDPPFRNNGAPPPF